VSERDDELAGTLAARLDRAAQTKLGRSLALFPLEAGGCGGCALEVYALRASVHRLARLGLSMVTSPLQADVLLVTGALTRAMAVPVRRAWEAAADPKWVVAVGECAADGGPFRGSYAVIGGASEAVPIDIIVPGCPPAPADILHALTALLEANAEP
jgi:Ni,Fe-hydrogenase III small subunit